MSKRQNKYVDLKTNGRLFPSWVLKNFKKYTLPEIIIKEGEDPCIRKDGKLEMKKYQEVLTKYMDYNSPYRDILIYHGLGSGKTASSINIYNMLYNYNPGWNVFVLLKATLKDYPWLHDLNLWLPNEEKQFRMNNIIFISYDSPTADKQFLEAVKNADTSKKSLYIVEEAHLFIRNVYTNINSRQGKRAQIIYDHIINDKKENEGVRVILLSGTPAINVPYELALMFNLLRPGLFPKSEATFNQMYVSNSGYQKINEATKNMFQRRILGLVSYYIGATPDLYAEKTLHYIDVQMSDYQTEIYNHFEEYEKKQAIAKKQKQGGSETYKSYTRQASNFVFPAIDQHVTGELRPRPGKFRVDDKEASKIETGKTDKSSIKSDNERKYLHEIQKFIDTYSRHLQKKHHEDEKMGHTLQDDIKKYLDKYNGDYEEFFQKENKSSLFNELHKSSAKMLNIIFNILKSPGPVLVYSNYVLMEGFQIFKLYLECFGFSAYKNRNEGKEHFRYTEYHGSIDREERGVNLRAFNEKDNIYGKLVKIIMISPAGAEGISLFNTRQVHIMEPYWHEVRISQMIGRAIRQCSHKDLPMSERKVDIFRYKSTKKNKNEWTTDQYIEDLARGKEGLIQSFLDTMKEAAFDCGINKAHNTMAQEYKCFQFDEQSLFEQQIGPAYKEDIYDDMKFNNGSNNPNSMTVKIKVMKINAVIQLSPDGDENPSYSRPKNFWYSSEYGTVYDYELHYPIGKIAIEYDLPKKLDKDTYIIDRLIPIPQLYE